MIKRWCVVGLLAWAVGPVAFAQEDSTAAETPAQTETQPDPVTEIAQQLASSDNWQDRFAIALVGDGEVMDIDIAALYQSVLQAQPENPHVLYRTLAFCEEVPETTFCAYTNLLGRYQAAVPGDVLPFMVAATTAERQADDATLWASLSAAAEGEMSNTYFGQELVMFLNLMDRHPGAMHLACGSEDCGPNAQVAGALGFAMALPDYSFLGIGACARKPELTGAQVDDCVKVAQLLQQSDQYVNASIGMGVELKLLDTYVDDPGRQSQVIALKTRLEELARAGQAAMDKLDFIMNEEVAREYIALYAERGELGAYRAFAERAGIDPDNPPPYCVTRADYEAAVEMIAPENLAEVDFPPICEDID